MITASLQRTATFISALVFICVLASSASSTISAQGLPPGTEVTEENRIPRAFELAVAGSYAAAEEVCGLNTRTVPETKEWHRKWGTNLIAVALFAREKNQILVSQNLASRAVLQLNAAQNLTAVTDVAFLAELADLRGDIADRLVGTSEEARIFRQQARQLREQGAPLGSGE